MKSTSRITLPQIQNLLERPAIGGDSPSEVFSELVTGKCFKLEKITSFGQVSPDNFWFDQHDPEWVALLQGKATLEFADGQVLRLAKGDYITIPARMRHRVKEVSEDAQWLALHFEG